MNKEHERCYIPIEKLKEDRNLFNYYAFCAEFESYARIIKFRQPGGGYSTVDFLDDRADVQHDMHNFARDYGIDRGDFAKMNNLEGLKGWYEMLVEYRKRLPEKDLYIYREIR